jgi:hypothetical protein
MSAVKLTKARLVPQNAEPIEVQFNPVSLQYEVSNRLDQQNRDATRRQIVTQSNARLAVELQFDTTPTGESVREQTLPIKRLLRPDEADTQAILDIVPPVVRFEWGSFIFSGLIESYRETLDFFSPEGVPLRAQVSIAMTHQTRATEPARPRNARRTPAGPTPAVIGQCTPQGLDGAAGVAGRMFGAGLAAGQALGLARGIADANGEASLRRSDQRALAVPDTGSSRSAGGAPERSGTGPAATSGPGGANADVGQHMSLSQFMQILD